MRNWTIAFQQHELTFVDASQARGDEEMDDHDLSLCFDRLEQGHSLRVACHGGMRRLAAYCMGNYAFVRAAGGVVSAPDGRRLLILRNQRWDLPKGGVERGETLRQAAMREVMEETGMHDIDAGALITKTYHIYNLYGGWHLKQTSWFAMRVPAAFPIVAQQEEGITGGEWVQPQTFVQRLMHSYATMRRVAERI